MTRECMGTKFPQKLLATNFDTDMFQVLISEFRGLELKTANNTLRDARRCLGCFSFPDEAGVDLPNLMVSLFKQGFLKRLVFSHVWHSKPNYLKSLKHSVKTFVAFLENDQRQHRAFGGLTTALGNLAGQLIVIMVWHCFVCACCVCLPCNLVFYEFNRHSNMMQRRW